MYACEVLFPLRYAQKQYVRDHIPGEKYERPYIFKPPVTSPGGQPTLDTKMLPPVCGLHYSSLSLDMYFHHNWLSQETFITGIHNSRVLTLLEGQYSGLWKVLPQQVVARQLSCSICHWDDFEKTALEVLTSLYQNACLLVLSLAGSFVNKNAIKPNIKASVLFYQPCLRFWGILQSNVRAL